MGIDFSKFSKDFQAKYEAVISKNSDGGEKITQKEYASFTKEDQQKLSQLLSGGSKDNSDGLINVAHSQDGRGATITFNPDRKENEGVLTLTPDTMKAYPGAARGYLHDGTVTLYDKAGNPITDSTGKVVTFDFGAKTKSTSGLAQWYMDHNGGKFDIETLKAFQSLDQTIDSSKETDKDIYQIMKENKLEDLKNASEDEKKGFFDKLDATAAYKKAQAKENLNQAYNMLDEAVKSGTLSEKGKALANYMMSTCQVLDNEIGLTKFKEFMYNASGITAGADALTKAVDDGDDKNLSGAEGFVEGLKGVGRGLDSFVGTQGAGFAAALFLSGEAAGAAGVGEAFSLMTTAYFTYDGISTTVDGIKEAVNAKTKEEAHEAGEKIGTGAFMLSGGAKFLGKAGKQVYDKHIKAEKPADGEYPSLSQIDKYSRDERINQANMHLVFFKNELRARHPKAQNQVGLYLDKLLESIPDDVPKVKVNDVKMWADYILPDGTVISRNHTSGTVPANDKVSYQDPENQVLFWIRDVNGKEHVLPCLSKSNVAKAKKILGYMSTLHEIPREQIVDVQNTKLSELKAKQQAEASQGAQTPSGKLQSVDEAKRANPADNAQVKIFKDWLRKDLENYGEDKKVDLFNLDPKADLNKPAPTVHDEVTSLVLHDKLGETLKAQYERAGKVFEEIIENNRDKISEMEKKFSTDKEQFATEFTHFLAEQLGVQGIEPKVRMVEYQHGEDGAFNWPTGELNINSGLKSPKEVETMIAHEFVHALQFKDIIAAKGEEGVKDILTHGEKNEKVVENYTREKLQEFGEDYDSFSPQEQAQYKDVMAEILADEIMENNAGLVKYAKEHPHTDGSLKGYLARIYKGENEKMADFDTPEYYSQVIENEAYFLGNGKMGGKINKPTAQELQHAKEYIAQHKDDVIITHKTKGANDKDIVTIDEKSAKVMHEIAKQLHKIGQSMEDDVVSYMIDSGFGTIDGVQKMTHRPKSVQSLYDKLVNYAKDNPDNCKMSDAMGDIRDIVGTRTSIDSGSFAQNPEVVALMKAGKRKEAIARAAELQSEPILQKLEGQIDQMQKEGYKGNVIGRISNYMGNNGISYLSERQLAQLQQYALKRGLVLKYALRSDKNPTEKYATKIRETGYTALQINIKMPDGRVFEVQIRGSIVNVFAEAEHVVYDLRTGKNIIAAHPEREPLYAPIKELLSEKNMDDATFNKYNEYRDAYYNHLRMLELGFDSKPPKMSDYGDYDIRLRADNLIVLEDCASKLDKAKTPQERNEIIAEYNRLVNSSK